MKHTEPAKTVNGLGRRTVTRERREEQLARRIALFLFVLYMIGLFYFLFFAGWYNHSPGAQTYYYVNLRPFHEIRRFVHAREKLGNAAVFLNINGNILGFIPFGFFLPLISKRLRNGFIVAVLGFLTSTLIEILQMLTKSGVCDIDDVILNTIGAVVGYILFLLCELIFRKAERKHVK
jgi:glycopeptide antibiotics resistance protein